MNSKYQHLPKLIKFIINFWEFCVQLVLFRSILTTLFQVTISSCPNYCSSHLIHLYVPIHPPHSSSRKLSTKVKFKHLGLYDLTSSCFPGFTLYHYYMYTHPKYKHQEYVFSHIHRLDLSHIQLSADPPKQQLPVHLPHMLLPLTGLFSPTPFPFHSHSS